MPNEKMPSQSYQNLGGINSKVSPYIEGPMQFLDIVNMDFATIGSLTKRWGSTQYIGQTLAGSIQGLFEFTKLDGSSYVVFSSSGGVWAGSSTGLQVGWSLSAIGTSVQSNAQISTLNYVGAFGFLQNSYAYYYTQYVQDYTSYSNAWYRWPVLQSQNYFSAVTFQNRMFYSDGSKILKFDGTTTSFFGLPMPFTTGGGMSYSSAAGGSNTLWCDPNYHNYFYASYVNDRGFQGPIAPIAVFDFLQGSTFTLDGGTMFAKFGSSTQCWADVQLCTPLGYGISSVNIWAYRGFTIGGGIVPGVTDGTVWNFPYTFVRNVPASGSTTTYVRVGATAGFNWNTSKLPPGTSYMVFGETLTPVSGAPSLVDTPLAPNYLEIYQNRLILAGFSISPSRFYYSDTGEPEGINVSSYVEVRTNDGDYITGVKSFLQSLYVFKKNSFHEFSGDSNQNFSLREISDQYGCLNNRCIVCFENTMFFLDKKGVMKFNGANIINISLPVEAIFNSMNLAQAYQTACMVHDKSRNQVLISIPINGSQTNNTTVVFDYNIEAWTRYDGFTPSVYAQIQGRLGNKQTFFGDASGRINYFGASFTADNGSGFTAVFKSRFNAELGQNNQKQFRRLFVNVDPITGSTSALTVNFYQDYGTSIVLTRTIYQNPFQTRLDFGISAKSLAIEISNFSAVDTFKLHGWVLSYRFQRGV